ncbi:MAG TPA: YicC family protein [Brevundimonas sp.]|uniref:YicC/YloC family endoribonuclease n=1 Tax=Brevundimonas sp. TaxID=1871086 RepID=UPI002BCA40FC|nr:YicC/YloC family endoribonuclease [Brevundimonas sp.]HRH19731.1 YicC family protein [Brevundimonas sp.]
MSGVISGMTGFGRCEGALGDWAWTVEARSVNGRSLDVKLKTPAGLDGLDREGREAAQARFQRGQVGITVQARRSERAAAIRINTEVLAAYREVMADLVDGGASPPTADGLLGLRGVLEAAEADDGDLSEVQAALARDLARALDDLKLARRDEGARLEPLILGFLDRISDLAGRARQEADAQTLAIRERFTKRVEDLTDGAVGLEDRIFQEAAMMAARADVREELDRLDAHTASGRALVAEGGAVGRRLDFLTQEFMREANTLCSKAATLALTSAGLDLKATIEQLREQVQNVE